MTRLKVTALLAGLVLAAGALWAYPRITDTWTGGSRSSAVACEDLPPPGEVQAALAQHAALVDRIEAVGDGVEVIPQQPCPGQDGTQVLILFGSRDDGREIEGLLQEESFGVPVELDNV